MTTLYEMTEAWLQLQDLEIEEEELRGFLDAAEGSIAEKVERVALYILDLEGDAKKIQDEEKRLAGRRKTRENRVRWLKEYLLANMMDFQMKKVETERVSVWYQKSTPGCSILDLESVPEGYKTLLPATWVENKRAIIAHWRKTGEQVDGADVSQGVHLRIK